MNRSRLTDWRPDPAALKNAARAAIVMPLCFALVSHFVSGDHAPVFAAFGSFALLVLVDFSGRPGPRLLAYLSLAAVGAVLITIGTLCSGHLVISTALAAVVTFLIFFSGVVNGYLAAARTAAVLLIVLPIMIPAGPSAIDDRLLGWLVACAVSIPSIFLLWPMPWAAELRKGCASACESIAKLVEHPDDPGAHDRAFDAVRQVRKRFLATPHRPTGPTGAAAAVAGLIDELGWTVSQFGRRDPSIADAAGADVIRMREVCATTLRRTAKVIKGAEGKVSTAEIDEARHDLVHNFARRVTDHELGQAALEEELARTFRLRLLSFSVTETADFANIAAGRTRAPGALGQRWLRVIGRQGRKAVAAERLMAEHLSPRSAWLRNSIRGAIGIALAVFVAQWVDADNAFWVVLGTLSVLRSNATGTESSVISSIKGTLIGIVIGAGVLVLIGEDSDLLWIALPLAVLVASYASAAISFSAGQAGFSVLVMVLFNLITPIGVEVGVIRVIDVGIGCAVSLVVGLLLWPRGARELVRRSLGDAYESASRLIANRVEAVVEGVVVDPYDPVRNEAIAAADRLDAALRQRLDESSAAHVDAESLVTLAACSGRLLRSSHAFRMMVLMPWYEPSPPEMSAQIGALNDRVHDWYSQCADAFRSTGEIPRPDHEPVVFGEETLALIEGAGDPRQLHSALTGAWVLHTLEYLLFMEERIAEHADRLFAQTPEEARDLQVG